MFKGTIVPHLNALQGVRTRCQNLDQYKYVIIIKFQVIIALFYSFLSYTGDNSPSTFHYHPRLPPRVIMKGLG